MRCQENFLPQTPRPAASEKYFTHYEDADACFFLHPAPVYEPVEIVGQKGRKAHHHGQISLVAPRRQQPQNDEHHVVGGVAQGVEGAAAEGEVHRQKAGGHGHGAGQKVRRAQRLEDEVKRRRHRRRQQPHEHMLPTGNFVHLHLGAVALKGVAQPADERQQRHGRRHAQIGDHLAVIRAGIGNIAVDQAENHRQRLPHGVALGVKKQGGDADEGGGEREILLPFQQEKKCHYRPHGRKPERFFLCCKIRIDAAQHKKHPLSEFKKAPDPTSSKT